MKYPWIDEYLLSKPGVTKNSENWNWDRYMTDVDGLGRKTPSRAREVITIRR